MMCFTKPVSINFQMSSVIVVSKAHSEAAVLDVPGWINKEKCRSPAAESCSIRQTDSQYAVCGEAECTFAQWLSIEANVHIVDSPQALHTFRHSLVQFQYCTHTHAPGPRLSAECFIITRYILSLNSIECIRAKREMEIEILQQQ